MDATTSSTPARPQKIAYNPKPFFYDQFEDADMMAVFDLRSDQELEAKVAATLGWLDPVVPERTDQPVAVTPALLAVLPDQSQTTVVFTRKPTAADLLEARRVLKPGGRVLYRDAEVPVPPPPTVAGGPLAAFEAKVRRNWGRRLKVSIRRVRCEN